MNLWIAMAILAQFSGATELSPQPAAAYITAAFETHPLVAFSEPGHGVAGTKAFFAALIRHPGFAGRVTDIVIECESPTSGSPDVMANFGPLFAEADLSCTRQPEPKGEG